MCKVFYCKKDNYLLGDWREDVVLTHLTASAKLIVVQPVKVHFNWCLPKYIFYLLKTPSKYSLFKHANTLNKEKVMKCPWKIHRPRVFNGNESKCLCKVCDRKCRIYQLFCISTWMIRRNIANIPIYPIFHASWISNTWRQKFSKSKSRRLLKQTCFKL